jgi:glycopeptide antibiotics resistance protein
LDRKDAKQTKRAKREGRDGLGFTAARIVAWMAVVAVTLWLLSLTLQEIGAGTRFGRIRLSAAKNELNIRPFINKAQPLRNLESPVRAVRRSAQGYLFIDVLGNVAVFIPFGAAVAAATLLSSAPRRRGSFWRWWLKVTLAGLTLSLVIELGQLAIPGRVTDIDDVILNMLGAATGALIMRGMFWLTRL